MRSAALFFWLLLSLASSAVADPAPAPTGLAVSPTGQSGQLLIHWNAVASNVPVTAYQLFSGSSPADVTTAVYVSSTAFLQGGLSDGQSYWYAVQVDTTDTASTSLSLTISSAPNGVPDPPGLTLTALSYGAGLNAAWSAPSTHGLAIGAYRLEGMSGSTVLSSVTISGSMGSAIVAAPCGDTQTARLVAVDVLGHESTPSAQSSVSYPCAPVVAPLSLSNGALALAWAVKPAAGDGTDHYEVRSASYTAAVLSDTVFVQSVTTSASAAAVTLTGIAQYSPLYYRVYATTSGGIVSAASNEIAPMAAPTLLTVSAKSGRVTLSWTVPNVPAALNQVGYELSYDTQANLSPNVGTTTSIAVTPTVSGAQALTTVSGLSDGTLYYFGLASVGGQGSPYHGPLSSIVSATPRIPSPVITSFIQVQGGPISLSWTSVDASPDTYVAYAVGVGHAPLSSYAVTWSAAVTSTALSGVSPSTDALATQWFVVASSTSSANDFTPTAGLLYAPVLSTPTGLAAVTTNGRVELSWGAVPFASEYQIYRSTQAGVSATTQASWSSAGPSFVDVFPANGQDNYYQVLARTKLALANSKVESPLSVTLTVDPALPPGIPGTYKLVDPSSQLRVLAAYLTVSAGLRADRVDLSWTPSALGSRLIDHYRIYRGGSLEALTVVASVSGTASTYDLLVGDATIPGQVYGVDAVDSLGLAGPRLTGTAGAYLGWPAPQTPTAFVVGKSARLSWYAPVNGGSHAFVAYEVSRRDLSSAPFVALAQVTTTSYMDLGLTTSAGLQPDYGIRVLDSAGGFGGRTITSVSFSIAASGLPPTAVAAVSAQTLIGTAVPAQIQWQASPSAEQVSSYLIYRDGAYLGVTSGSPYVDTLTVTGSAHTYQVQALNAVGLGTSTTASPAPLAITPPQVGPLTLNAAVDATGNAVPALRLNWGDIGIPAGADHYSVYRSSGAFSSVTAAAYLGDVTTNAFVDVSVVTGSLQSYVVLASVNGFQTSSPTAALALSVNVSPAPALPTGLSAVAKSSGLTLKWDPQSQAREYWVFRSTAPLGSYPNVAFLTTATSATYTDTTGDPAQTYSYGVSALNELARGPVAELTAVPAPGKVQALSVTAGYAGGRQVGLDWSAPSAPGLAVSYEVRRATFAATAFDSGNSSLLYSGSGLSYIDSTVAAGTPYYYQVRSFNQVFSTDSDIIGPMRAYDPLGNVQGVNATGGPARVDAVWDDAGAAAGVTGYAISVLPDPNFGTAYSALVQGHSYSVTNVPAAQGISITVSALNSAGGSPSAVTVYAVANNVAATAPPLSLSASVGFFEPDPSIVRVLLSWSPPGLGESVLLYRSVQAIPLSLAAGGPTSPLYLSGVSGVFATLTDTAVDTNHAYYYAVSFVGPAGLPGAESLPFRTSAVTPFAYPDRVTLSAQAGVGRVDISWTAPSYLGSTGSLSDPAYRLYRYSTVSATSVHGLQTPDPGFPVALSSNAYTDDQVVNWNTYQYVLAVVDSLGREQQGSVVASVAQRTPHGSVPAPTGVEAIPGDDSVTLRLIGSVYDTQAGLHFNVYRRPQSSGDYVSPVASLYLAGPQNVQAFGGVTLTVVTLRDDQAPTPQNTLSYCYTVSQVNEYGESGRSQEVCTTPYRPLVPTNKKLALTVTGKKDVLLAWDPSITWQASDSNAPMGFRLFRSMDGGTTYTTLADSLSLTLTAYVDSSTDFGASYVYRLVPIDSKGFEGLSYNLASVVIPSAKNAVLIFRNSFNPAGGEVAPVQFSLLQPGHAWVRVYTLEGDFVVSLFEEDVAVASVENPYLSEKKAWDGKNAEGQIVASGVYLVHLEAAGYRENARVAVIK